MATDRSPGPEPRPSHRVAIRIRPRATLLIVPTIALITTAAAVRVAFVYHSLPAYLLLGAAVAANGLASVPSLRSVHTVELLPEGRGLVARSLLGTFRLARGRPEEMVVGRNPGSTPLDENRSKAAIERHQRERHAWVELVGTQADPRSRRWRTAVPALLAAPHDRLMFRFRAPAMVMAQRERQLRLLYPELAGEHAPLIETSARARSAIPTWGPAYPELRPAEGLWAVAAVSVGGTFLTAVWIFAVAFAV